MVVLMLAEDVRIAIAVISILATFIDRRRWFHPRQVSVSFVSLCLCIRSPPYPFLRTDSMELPRVLGISHGAGRSVSSDSKAWEVEDLSLVV